MRGVVGVACLLVCTVSLAEGLVRPEVGALEGKHCTSCHDANFYQRPLRRIQSEAQLLERVMACNQNLGIGLLPGEERQVAGYLWQQYYRSGK